MRSVTGVALTLLALLLLGSFVAGRTQQNQGPPGSLASTLAPDTGPPPQSPPEPDECDDPLAKKPGREDLKLLPTRKYAPAIGTGGPVAGPTGLFTVYDGKTLREGDYTYSLSYSNFDRDPGNVDISEVPNSFHLGLPYRTEFFFSYDVYRGVKVNNPQNLSSFYLPNSQMFLRAHDPVTGNFGPLILQSGPAIILAPERVSGTTLGGFGTIFRPTGNQPFVQFPFIGGPGPNFGLTGNRIAPPFSSRLGTPSGAAENFGAASNFPGIGSVFGSILPGIVLTTRRIPANLTFEDLIVPDLFTIAPTYLPDAPFINRLYGESSLGTVTVGFKIRFRDRLSRANFGVLPFYRFYTERANDFRGFNQLQRGASPGGNLGDFGLISFFSGRATRHITVSSNLGYILNSNPKSDAFGVDDAVLLDRPDELLYGLAADFYFEKADHWQPIVELRGTKYVGGRTPNALPNDPVDFLVGARYFLSERHGVTVGYRLHLNQQGGGGGASAGPPPPANFGSSNPHGFMVQLWAGRRAPRKPPTVTVRAKASPNRSDFPDIVLACPPDQVSASASCPLPDPLDMRVPLEAMIEDADGKPLGLPVKRWETKGGRIVGEGQEVVWDLSGAAADKDGYVAVAVFEDEEGTEVRGTFCIRVRNCPDCVPTTTPPPPPPPAVCPTLVAVVPGQPSVVVGTAATFTARVEGLPAGTAFTYRWTVSGGTIVGAADAETVTVDTAGRGGGTVTATLQLVGLDPSCPATAQGETPVTVPPSCKPFDAYGAISYNDEKARLDNFVIALNEDRQLDGYLIAYSGGTAGRNIGTIKNPLRGGVVDAQHRIDRATSYIRDRRGYTKRIEAVKGGIRNESSVELYICEANAMRPAPKPETAARHDPPSRPPGRKGARPRVPVGRWEKRTWGTGG